MNDTILKSSFTFLVLILCFLTKTTAQTIDLDLSITAPIPTMVIYENINFDLTLKNNGSSSATGVRVSLPLPNGFSYVSSSGNGNYAGWTEIWDVGTIPAGGTAIMNVSFFVNTDDSTADVFAQVSAADQNDTDSTPNNNFNNVPSEDDEAVVTFSTGGGGNNGGGNGIVNFTQIPVNRQLLTRNEATNAGTAVISGTIPSNSNFNQIRVKRFREGVFQNTYTDNVVAGGNFNLNVSIPAELANYRLDIYGYNGVSEVYVGGVDELVAGDVFIINGQSNAEAGAMAWQSDQDTWVRSYNANFGWNYINFSFPGQWAARIGKAIVDNQNIPVALFNQAVGAQNIDFFLKNNSNPSTGNYGELMARLETAGVKNNVKAAFWFHGEADGWQATTAEYKSKVLQLHNAWVSDYQIDKCYLYQLRTLSCSHPYPYVLEAQRQVANEVAGIETMSTSNANHDGCHFDYYGGYETLGNRMHALLEKDFYGGSSYNVEAPDFNSATASGSQITIQTKDVSGNLQVIGTPWNDFKLEGSNVSVTNGYVSGTSIILNLNGSPAGATGISYLAHPGNANNWIVNSNGVGLLSFYNAPIGGNSGGDTTPPSVSLSTVSTNVNGAFTVNVSFSENISGLSLSDFSVTNGSKSSLSGSGSTYSFVVSPSSNGQVTVRLPSNRVTDSAGNNNTGSNTLYINYSTGGGDNTAPSVSLSTSNNSVSGPFSLNVSFSENVTGLSNSDFSISNGTASNLTGSGASYSVTINPINNGNVSINLPSNRVIDGAGNSNTSSNTLVVSYSSGGGGGNPDCNNINISTSNGTITVSGLGNAPISQLQVFDATWQTILNCAGNCNDTEVIAATNGATYFINAKFYNSSWQPICEISDFYTVDGDNTGGGNNGGGGNGIDLDVSITTASPTYSIYNYVDYTVTINNTGTENATGVVLSFPFPDGFVHSSFTRTQGSFDTWLQEWNVGDIAAGSTAILEVQLFTLVSGQTVSLLTQIKAADQNDVDSSPNNNSGSTPNEDDEASATVSSSSNRGVATIQVDQSKSILVHDIFPNPADQWLKFDISAKENDAIAFGLYDAMGRLVKNIDLDISEGHNGVVIDINDLPSGMYQILFHSSKAHQPIRFIKQRQ